MVELAVRYRFDKGSKQDLAHDPLFAAAKGSTDAPVKQLNNTINASGGVTVSVFLSGSTVTEEQVRNIKRAIESEVQQQLGGILSRAKITKTTIEAIDR